VGGSGVLRTHHWDQIVTQDDVLAFLEGKIAKWQMPKGVVWIDEVPKTSVGKFSEKTLRDEYAGTLMSG
jgi:fatty-acyl-CoA synthase